MGGLPHKGTEESSVVQGSRKPWQYAGMGKHVGRKFSGAAAIFVRAGTALEFLMAFLIVVPLTLWFAWARHSTVAEPMVLTLFCLSFVWLNISILRWQRCLRRLGSSSPGKLAFGLGPRPEGPDELSFGSGENTSVIPLQQCCRACQPSQL